MEFERTLGGPRNNGQLLDKSSIWYIQWMILAIVDGSSSREIKGILQFVGHLIVDFCRRGRIIVQHNNVVFTVETIILGCQGIFTFRFVG